MTDYVVLSKLKVATLIGFVTAIGCVAVWFATDWIESYGRQMSALIESAPERAAAELSGDMRLVAVVQGVSILALSMMMAWYGVRALLSGAMPPPGAWIVEGQRIRTGAAAVRAGWIMLICALIVAALGSTASVAIWRLALEFVPAADALAKV